MLPDTEVEADDEDEGFEQVEENRKRGGENRRGGRGGRGAGRGGFPRGDEEIRGERPKPHFTKQTPQTTENKPASSTTVPKKEEVKIAVPA